MKFFLTFLLTFSPAIFADAEWIFVRTADKLPLIRTGGSPFEFFPDGFDPNGPNTSFGPDKEKMFLPVQNPSPPTVNQILETVTATSTVGVDGTYRGNYVAPNWVRGWTVAPQNLDVSKSLKLRELATDYSAALDGGWIVGPYVFPYSEEFLRLLGSRKTGLSQAISEGLIPGTAEVTFSDKNDKKVSVNLTQITNNFAQYFVDFMVIKEKEVDAREAIANATTVNEVDAVTWNF